MTVDAARIRFDCKAAPVYKVHRCPKTGNVWSWCSTRAGGCWRREADGREAPCAARHRLNSYDSMHRVTWVAGRRR